MNVWSRVVPWTRVLVRRRCGGGTAVLASGARGLSSSAAASPVASSKRVGSLSVGILGVPNVGKSTIFNLLTHGKAEAANFPFCTIDPNHGVMKVADPNLATLASFIPTRRVVPAEVRVTDIAGLVKGAAEGAGLGNKFLSHVRQVDALVHVVRCFQDDQVTYVDGVVDGVRDADVITTELILADVQTVERALAKKKGDAALAALLDWLGQGRSARDLPAVGPDSGQTGAALAVADTLGLLSAKPLLYVANVSESQVGVPPASLPPADPYRKLTAWLQGQRLAPLPICAALEQQLQSVESEAERLELLQAAGLDASATAAISRAVYALLRLRSFYTAGEQEIRAWSVREGMAAVEAAARIHSDIARGFIRAETYNLRELVAAQGARARVRVRHEGRGYVVQEGDVFHFLFKV